MFSRAVVGLGPKAAGVAAAGIKFPPYAHPPRPANASPNMQVLVKLASESAHNTGKPIQNPPQNPLYFYEDKQIVVAYDAYPKAEHHLLVMPQDASIRDLSKLTKQHLPVLQHMQEIGTGVVNHIGVACWLGFHALPSLPMLHMHVLSCDLDSPNLKKKKHYNSFSTEFFLSVKDVIADVKKHGRVTLIDGRRDKFAELERGDMVCVWCRKPLTNMPEVRGHLASCSYRPIKQPTL